MIVLPYVSVGADANPKCMKCVYRIYIVGGNMDIVLNSIYIYMCR